MFVNTKTYVALIKDTEKHKHSGFKWQPELLAKRKCDFSIRPKEELYQDRVNFTEMYV
jgi:hypothetical protein